MAFQTTKLNESENSERKVKLNNEEVSVQEFNKTLEGLKGNQRIIESSEGNFHTVERFYD